MKIKLIYWELLLEIKEIYKTIDCNIHSNDKMNLKR